MNAFINALKRNNYYAKADIIGSSEFPEVRGSVYFYPVAEGTLVKTELFGLPIAKLPCEEEIFAFHIHEGGRCTGDEEDPFKDAGMHYNPRQCMHPNHAGDMPPIFGNGGIAWSAFYTNRFIPAQVVGKTVIVHEKIDDFTTQPAGNAGKKIACGEIRRNFLNFV